MMVPLERSATDGPGKERCPFAPGSAAFDPFDQRYLQDPAAHLARAREELPIFEAPELGYWVITRYDSVKEVFRDNVTFSPSIALERVTPGGPDIDAILASYGYAMGRTLVNEDEPAHMPRRRLLLEPFSPAELREHEPRIRALVRSYVDGLIDRGEADLVSEMLWEAPLLTAMVFMGVPDEDMTALRRLSVAHVVNTWGRPNPKRQREVAHMVGSFWQRAGALLEKMRADPDRPGWMQYAIRLQRQHPDIITDSYLHSMMMAGIVAAHETTANAMANALRLLLEHREAWTAICEDPDAIANAVEECLRHSGSVVAWRRRVTADTRIEGVEIPAGAKLLLVMASANHDPRHFPAPDDFDIWRENATDHLTFGFGSHQCMGRDLARMEIQLLLQELTTRLPHLELAPQRFDFQPNIAFRGPEQLHVRWDPALNPERSDPGILARSAEIRLGTSAIRARTLELVAEEVEPVAEDVLRVRLRSPRGIRLPSWSPGAHLDLECGIPGRWRQYSLCGELDDAMSYEVAVQREPLGRGGSAWIHEALAPGTRINTRGPRNYFRLDEGARRLIFVAGGIGITPVKAMAARAAQLGLDYEIHYCGRSRARMAFADQLAREHGERLNLHIRGETRRLVVADLVKSIDPRDRLYACGPGQLVEAIRAAAEHLPPDVVHFEYFAAPEDSAHAAGNQPFDVELVQSLKTVHVASDQTLLDALRRAGVPVESDCEQGLCGSCEVTVLDGEVEHRDYVLANAERAANNRMMTCCSRAKEGRLVLEL